MWTLLKLAVRNVVRQRSRSALTLGALGLGVLMSLVLGSFITGVQKALLDDLVKGRLGAIQVHRKGYFDARNNQPLKLDLEMGGELERRLLATPGVAGAAPRIVFSGLVGNGTSSTLVLAQGVDPEREADAVPFEQRGVDGAPVSARTPHGAVLGATLAKAMQVQPGASLTLQASTRAGKENAVDLDLVGTVQGTNPLESKRLALVPLAYAQELLGMPGRVTEYAVAVKDLDRVDEVAQALRATLGPDLEVHTWRELRPNVADIFAIQHAVLAAISLVFLIIAVIGVANTLLMSVLERTREIGTMMAVGVTRATIAVLFVLEAASQAILGGVTGVVLAALLARLLASHGGLAFPVEPGGAPLVVLPELPNAFVALALGLSTLGAVGAALYPAWRAASLRPVEALRDA